MSVVCKKIRLVAETEGMEHYVVFHSSNDKDSDYEHDLDNLSTQDFRNAVAVLKLRIDFYNSEQEKKGFI